eukprot:9857225-Lingulodinium_polyedra.AAC.1
MLVSSSSSSKSAVRSGMMAGERAECANLPPGTWAEMAATALRSRLLGLFSLSAATIARLQQR